MAKFIKIFFVGILLVGGVSAQADSPTYTSLWDVGCKSLADCAETLVKYAVSLALPVAAIFIIWSGFLFATAQGNEEKLRSAKSTLTWTIIGLAVAVGAWTLAVAFKNFFVRL